MITVTDFIRRVLEKGGDEFAIFAPVKRDYGVMIERVTSADGVSTDHVLTLTHTFHGMASMTRGVGKNGYRVKVIRGLVEHLLQGRISLVAVVALH